MEDQNYEVEDTKVEDTVESNGNGLLSTAIKVGVGVVAGLAIPKIFGITKKGVTAVKDKMAERKGKKKYAKTVKETEGSDQDNEDDSEK